MKMICGQLQLLLYAQMGRDRDKRSSAVCLGAIGAGFAGQRTREISVPLTIISSLNARVREVYFFSV